MKRKLLIVLLCLFGMTQINAQISSFPYTYGFENENTGPTGCNPTYVMQEAGWLNAAGDDMDWTNDINTTGSGYGASQDHTPGAGVLYMYLEASCSANRQAWLESPVFDFTSTSNPEVSFWYHMYGANIGVLTLEIDTTGAGSWISIFTISGQQQINSAAPWLEARVALGGYAGASNVKFRITGTTLSTGLAGDMGIDDFMVENVLANDAGVVSIDNPMNPVTVGINPVDVTIKNFGSDTLFGADVEWSVNGTPQTTFAWTGSLAKDSLTGPIPVTIGTYNFPKGFTTIKAWTALPNAIPDSANGNDTTELIVCTPLKGVYTLGGVTADFNTFNDFSTAINTCGVDSHVVVNVNPGTYNERLILNRINGTSAAATVTVNGGNPSLVTLSNNTFSNVYLNGADFITIKNMTLENTGTVDAYGVQLRDSAMNNTIDSCVINMSMNTGLSDVIGVSASNIETSSTSEGSNAYSTRVSNNMINGGEKGIHFEGAFASRNRGNRFINNVIDSVEDYGIYIDDQDDISILRNEVSNIRNVNGDGIYCFDIMDFDISYNKVIDAPDYGLYISDGNFDAVPNGRARLINNMVSSRNDYGIYLDDVEEIDVWHNTVYNKAGINGAFRVNDMIGLDIRNNIFMSETDYAFESLDNITLGANVVDYNAYWTNGALFVRDGVNSATLAAWQTAQPTANVNSIEIDPLFIATNDLHLYAPTINDLGDNTVGILLDIDGDVRPAGPNVDMGADEFTPFSDNAVFVGFAEPGSVACGDSAMPITVIVKNIGDTIFNMNINVDVTGDLVTSLPYAYSDTLLFNEYDTVTVGTINTYAGINYNLLGYVDLLNDQDLSNDTSSLYSFIAIPYEPIGIDGVGCDGDTATIYGFNLPVVYEWYDSLVGGNLVGTGNSYQIPSVTTQNTYYLQYSSVGADSLSTGFPGGNGQAGNMFDVVAINPVNILSFDANLNAGTHATVDIWYRVGTHVGFENSSAGWTLIGTATNVVSTGNGIGTPIPLPINLTIPAGQTYSFYVDASNSVAYTNGGTVGNVWASNADMQILEGIGKASNFGGTFSVRNWNGTIHYGSSTTCSTFRTPVSATLDTTAVASFTSVPNYNVVSFDGSSTTHQDSVSWDFGDGNTSTALMPTHTYTVDSTYVVCLTAYSYCGTDVVCDTMTVCDSLGANFTASVNGFITNFTDMTAGNPTVWFWDFGDGNTSSQQNPSHTYNNDSTYLVTLVVQNYCGQFSVYTFNVITVGIEDFNNNSVISVFPNPSGGEFTLNLANYKSDNVTVAVFNQLGKAVYNESLNRGEQSSNYSLDLTGNAKGVYFLRVSSDKGVITKRIIIK
ncbi:MAG: PKD domain-containing protein [Vicingaceae bacterium]|nr:PKD domain-containing protein [Vicingaceae bacterium]